MMAHRGTMNLFLRLVYLENIRLYFCCRSSHFIHFAETLKTWKKYKWHSNSFYSPAGRMKLLAREMEKMKKTQLTELLILIAIAARNQAQDKSRQKVLLYVPFSQCHHKERQGSCIQSSGHCLWAQSFCMLHPCFYCLTLKTSRTG